MNPYESPAQPKHETQLQTRRRELKTEEQKLSALKETLRARIASSPSEPHIVRAA